MRHLIILVGLAVSACVPTEAEPPADMAYIEISQGGTFSGSYMLRIYEDDTVRSTQSAPFGKETKPRSGQGRAGYYRDAAALLRAEGPGVARALGGDPEYCPDYGADVIKAVPPVGRFSTAVAGCEHPAMSALLGKLAAVAAGQ
jgi:hypothetical protein